MTKVCALCDAGFKPTRDERASVPLTEVNGKPANGYLVLPQHVVEQIQAWAKRPASEQLSSNE